MPSLLLLRHAKAERARPGESDHERVLAERGRTEAAAVGRAMRERGERPDLVLCSTSVRTRETFELAGIALRGKPEVRFLKKLFDAGGDYFGVLKQEGGGAASVLVVGHNPAIQETALRLAESLASKDGARLKQNFPPAALAIFDFDGGWLDLAPGTARLAALITP